MLTFYQLGENMNFPPFFIPFQYFFSPNLLFGHIFAPTPLPGGGGIKQKNIHTCRLKKCFPFMIFSPFSRVSYSFKIFNSLSYIYSPQRNKSYYLSFTPCLIVKDEPSEKSEYEKVRDRNIREREQMLVALGLQSIKGKLKHNNTSKLVYKKRVEMNRPTLFEANLTIEY